MSAPAVSPSDDLKVRARAARERFVASGTNISEWSRERNFSIALVNKVLMGQRSCRRGESHRIAVALGIKRELSPPGAPVAPLVRADGLEPVR